jgi:hypothetical protein
LIILFIIIKQMSNLFYRNYSYNIKKNNIFKNYLYYIGLIGFALSYKKQDMKNYLYINH